MKTNGYHSCWGTSGNRGETLTKYSEEEKNQNYESGIADRKKRVLLCRLHGEDRTNLELVICVTARTAASRTLAQTSSKHEDTAMMALQFPFSEICAIAATAADCEKQRRSVFFLRTSACPQTIPDILTSTAQFHEYALEFCSVTENVTGNHW